MLIQSVPIQKNQHIKSRFYRLVIQSEKIAQLAMPGQFLHLQVRQSIQPLLRRPFSIYRIAANNSIEILYEVVGVGSKILSQRQSGESLNIYGPIGTGFSTNYSLRNIILVGGGIGVAPLLFLGKRLLKQNNHVKAILGYRTVDDVIGEKDFLEEGLDVQIITNDGSYGATGLVTDTLKEIMNNGDLIFTCGPTPMLKAVSQLCLRMGNDCEASIHSFMGCGFGVCLGCVFPTQNGYQRVCIDGPVFKSNELIF